MNENIINLVNFTHNIVNHIVLKNWEIRDGFVNALKTGYKKSFIGDDAIDITKCTDSELKALGFGRWKEESTLRLIPHYLVDVLPPETVVISINGDVSTLEKADKDIRFGYIAYGVFPRLSVWQKIRKYFSAR